MLRLYCRDADLDIVPSEKARNKTVKKEPKQVLGRVKLKASDKGYSI